MTIVCQISVGEFVDKLTILAIKSERIVEKIKRREVDKELHALQHIFTTFDSEKIRAHLEELRSVNLKMWICNDRRKQKIRDGEFDQEYMSLTIQESELNDRRFLIKDSINSVMKSHFSEQKNYGWL